MQIIRVALLGAAFLFAANCTNYQNGANGTTSPVLSSIYTNILVPYCQQCHSTGNMPDGTTVNFATQTTSYNTLHSSVRGSGSPNCSGLAIVVGGSSQTSYLMGLISSSFAVNNFDGRAGCTPYPAHLGFQNLSASDVEAFVNWIQNGASQN